MLVGNANGSLWPVPIKHKLSRLFSNFQPSPPFCPANFNRDAATIYLAFYSFVKIDRPNQAMCSCYLGPGGQAARHLCPLTYWTFNCAWEFLPWQLRSMFQPSSHSGTRRGLAALRRQEVVQEERRNQRRRHRKVVLTFIFLSTFQIVVWWQLELLAHFCLAHHALLELSRGVLTVPNQMCKSSSEVLRE